ncbi:acyltransferase family protein [Sphingomonas arenae]|uniref:acyltransferase family protein n=1 Tax=Sphingomonas arenae TaxID=2812555 RepID=UPI001967D230|nr:acyltransferase [Sphingomonas arenae]
MGKRSTSMGAGVDAFRVLLMLPIILAHSWHFAGPVNPGLESYLPLMAGHAAVPFFFLASGSLLRWQEGEVFAVPRWLLRKLLPLFLVWIAVYVAAAWLAGRGSLLQLVGTIDEGGPTRHLWFLPALGFALSLVAVSLRLLGRHRTWAIVLTMALIGLFQGGYQLFLGLAGHWLRCAFLTAPLFVMIGVEVASRPVTVRPMVAASAAVLFYMLQVADDVLIASAPAHVPHEHPTVTLATIPYAFALFLLARSLSGGAILDRLAALRRFNVTIYCMNPLILLAIQPLIPFRGLAVAFGLTLFVLVSCIGISQLWTRVQSRAKKRAGSGERLAHAA